MAEINAWSSSTSVFSAFPTMLTEAALTPGNILKNWDEMVLRCMVSDSQA